MLAAVICAASLASPSSCCFTNPNLTKPSPNDPARPLGWNSVAITGLASATTSRFRWTEPTTSNGLRALQIVGGVGRWSTKLAASVGQTLSVRFEFRAANVSVRAHPKYGGCARLSAVLSANAPEDTAAPRKVSNASHMVVQQILCYGQAVRSGRWMPVQMGDFVVPTKQLYLSIWLADIEGFAPTEIWARRMEATETPPPPPPAGVAQSLAKGGTGDGAWSLWAEHANFKVQHDSLPPPTEAAFLHVDRGPLQLRAAIGERTAIQLAVRSGGFWGRWRWSGWQTVASTVLSSIDGPVVQLRQVGFVNITGGTAPYGQTGFMADPLTPLRLATGASADTDGGDVFLHCADKVRPPYRGVQTCTGGQTTPFWLSVTVPVGTAAGQFCGDLTLERVPRKGDNDGVGTPPVTPLVMATVPINLRVLNFTIPTEPSVQIRSRVTFDW